MCEIVIIWTGALCFTPTFTCTSLAYNSLTSVYYNEIALWYSRTVTDYNLAPSSPGSDSQLVDVDKT